MNKQVITTPAGERLVVIPEADFEALVDAADENADRLAVEDYDRRLAAGEVEFIPSAIVERLISGENKVRVWREHRGMTTSALAAAAGLSQPYVSQIETGKRKAKAETLAALAKALRIDADDLEPRADLESLDADPIDDGADDEATRL